MPWRCSKCIQTPGGHTHYREPSLLQYNSQKLDLPVSFGLSPARCGLVILVSVSWFSISLIYDYSILLYLILEIPLCFAAAYETSGHALFEQSDSGLQLELKVTAAQTKQTKRLLSASGSSMYLKELPLTSSRMLPHYGSEKNG